MTERCVAVYFRVSSDAQDVASQHADVYAKAAEQYPGVPIREPFKDEGISAFHRPLTERPGSSALLAAIVADEILAVIVQSQDRLSRGEPLEIQLFLAACAEHGVDVHTVTGGQLHLSDEEARFATGLIASAAAYTARKEAREKADRSKRGRRHAASKGLWPGGPPPPGFKRAENGILERDEPLVAPLMEELGQLYVSGTGVMEIARRMKALTGDHRWNRQRVGDCLDNPTYNGWIINRGEKYKGLHDPIWGDDLWQRIQDMRAEAKATNRRQTRTQPFTSAILRCGDCGGRLTPHTDRRGTAWLDYECWTCRASYHAEFLDMSFLCLLNVVHEFLCERLIDPTVGMRADQDIELVQAELAELRRRMKALLPLVEDEDADAIARHRHLQTQAQAAEKTLSRLLSETGERRTELEQLRDAITTFADCDTPGHINSRLIEAWTLRSVAEKHAFIVATAEKIETFGSGELRVKLRSLAKPQAVPISLAKRHTEQSKAFRRVGLGAGSAS